MPRKQGPILNVVTVPDFLGPARHRFEAQCLFFLASWIECSGRTADFPLHLACIGEPPAPVTKLAERADARVTVHEPLSTRENRFLNKLRAEDVAGAAERFALVDVVILLLGDRSALAQIAPVAVAAVPEMHQGLPLELWHHLYRGLGVEPPAERIASRVAELDLPLKYEHFDGEETLLESMLPYYNGGGVVSPWRLGLMQRWKETYDRILAIEPPNHPRWNLVRSTDQPALAVTIDLLCREGLGFERLPSGVNALWQDLHAEAVEPDQVHLFHATTIFRHMPPQPVTREGLLRELDRYRWRLWRRSRRTWTRERRLARAFQNTGRLLRAPAKISWLDERHAGQSRDGRERLRRFRVVGHPLEEAVLAPGQPLPEPSHGDRANRLAAIVLDDHAFEPLPIGLDSRRVVASDSARELTR